MNIPNLRVHRRRALALGLASCLLLSLCSCHRTSTLQLQEGVALQVPVVQHIEKAEELNTALAMLFTPLVESGQALAQAGQPVRLSYELVQEEEQVLLYAALEGDGSLQTASDIAPSVRLCNTSRFAFAPLVLKHGRVYKPDNWSDAALRDASFLSDALFLSALGIPPTLSTYGDIAMERVYLDALVRGYEHIRGETVSISGVVPTLTDVLTAKACVLGLLPYYDELTTHTDGELYALTALDYVSALSLRVQQVDLSQGGLLCTVQQAIDQLDALLLPSELLPSGGVSALLPARWQAHGCDTLTRLTLARLFADLYRALSNQLRISPGKESPQDCQDADAAYAFRRHLISGFPSYRELSPNLSIRTHQLPDLLRTFCQALLSAKAEQSDAYGPLTTQQSASYLCAMLANTYDAYAAQKEAGHTQQVVNDRPYDWYMSQDGTGPYSAVNCMPTSVTMALKWQDGTFSTPVEQVRRRVDPRGTGGWTLYQAQEALDAYGARYNVLSLAGSAQKNLDAMIRALDAGSLLFCMMHEGDAQMDGHCMLVYGYRRTGDDLWFYVQDPGLIGVKDAYGQPEGKARELEAHYAQWITARWTSQVLVLQP